MSTKVIDGVDYEVVDMMDAAPVELDQPSPPDPKLTRWEALVDRDIEIYHGGDASAVIPFPRPDWADPEADVIGVSASHSHYRSAWARVASRRSSGVEDGDVLSQACVAVRAKIDGDGMQMVGIATSRNEKGMRSLEVSLYPDEVADLIEVLRAAVDLLGGAQ